MLLFNPCLQFPIRPWRKALPGALLRASGGFTLLELMVVLSIMGILLGIAVPSFQRSVAQNAINSSINTLAADVKFARSEAVKRGISVALCPSVSPYTSCAAGGQWVTGWIIFIDRDNNNARDTNATANEDLLRVQQDFGVRNLSIAGTTTVNSIRFNNAGASAAPLSLATNHDGLSTQAQTETSRVLCLSTAGRARTTLPGVATCS